MLRLCFLLLAFLALPRAAQAHDGLPVVVSIEQRAEALYLMRLVLPPSVPEHVRPGFSVAPGCTPVRDDASAAPTVDAVLVRCPKGLGGAMLQLSYRSGKPAVPTLVRIAWQSGETRSVLAAPGETAIALPSPESAGGVLRDYLVLGVEHILMGWDHLTFLLCLLLIARTPRRILLTVTGFTLGHAVTITAVTLGVAGLSGPPVEASIALSIMFLAAEIIRPQRDTLTWRYPVAISAAFGILHGFGFASALRDIGLPQTEVPLALLAFNLGIEAGQLIFVLGCAILWLVLRQLARSDWRARLATTGPAAVASLAGIVAAYWFVDRTIGMF